MNEDPNNPNEFQMWIRAAYIGDGLSHVAFGTMSVAAVLHLTNDMLLVLPVTVLCAILLLKRGQKSKIQGDAAIAMLSVGALAFGYLITNLFSASANISGDVCSTLFGSTSILTLRKEEVWLCVVLSLTVIVLYILFYNRIFAVTFDEDFANASGISAARNNLMIAVITAVIIVLAMNLVGSLLISALVIFPAVSAMQIFHSFRQVSLFSVIFSFITTLLGMLVSILMGTPVGSTIVVAEVAAFLLCTFCGKLKEGF